MNLSSRQPDIKTNTKPLPPLKNVASRPRIVPQTHFDNDQSQQGGQIMKPKLKKGYQPAQFIHAIQYFKSQAYTRKQSKRNGQVEYKDLQLMSQTSQLQQYGLGIYLYLQFIKRLSLTFLIMSAFTILPVCYAYLTGTGLQSFKSSYTISLAKSSIGNIADGDVTAYLVFTISDLLSMIVLFGFYLHWRGFHNEVVTKEMRDHQMLNPSHYALTVVGEFDSSISNLEQHLTQYITNIVTPQFITQPFAYPQSNPMHPPSIPKRKIFQVQVLYNFKGNFSKFVEYDQLIEQKQKQRQLIKHTSKSNEEFNKIQEQLEKVELKIGQISQIFQPYEAIVHFQNIKARLDFINFSRRYSLFDTFSYSMKRLFCCQPLPPKEQLFLERYPLLIKSTQLSRPEQINWQNLDISAVSRVIRWVFSILFLLISILITSSAIVLCTLYVSSNSACSNFDSTITLSVAQKGGSQMLYCYCAVHFTQIYTDTDIQTACSSLSNTILYSNLMQVGASLVSSISNILLITAVTIISKYVLKPSSRPMEYSFTFVGVLLSNYINASILPLVMNGDIFGFTALAYLKFIKFIDFTKVSIFKDYTVDWYAVVAPYYINFLIIAILSPIINLIVSCLMDGFTRWRVKRACQNTKKAPIIQKQANQMLSSNQFDLATQKAIICLNFFIAIMYSSLLPILIPITTVYLVISFFCKKYIILRYSVRIPADAALSQKTISLIPFIILLHFLLGIWSHTVDGIFSTSSYVIHLSLTFLQQKSQIVQRALIDILMLAGGVLIAAWIIVDFTLVKFFSIIADCCKEQIQVPKQLASLQHKSYQDSLKMTNILGSYKLVNNPTYGHAIKAYNELKKRKEKEMKKNRTNRTNRMTATVTDRISLQTGQSPEKFGQQTLDSLNLKNHQEIPSVSQFLPSQSYRYQNKEKQ